jgi:hypothetical protein
MAARIACSSPAGRARVKSRSIWAGRLAIAGIAAAIAHVILLGLTVFQTLSAHDAQWQSYWIKFLALDFPLSLGVAPVTWISPPSPAGPLHDVANFWWPLAYHGTIGTAWWYVVGAYIAARLARRYGRARITRSENERSED